MRIPAPAATPTRSPAALVNGMLTEFARPRTAPANSPERGLFTERVRPVMQQQQQQQQQQQREQQQREQRRQVNRAGLLMQSRAATPSAGALRAYGSMPHHDAEVVARATSSAVAASAAAAAAAAAAASATEPSVARTRAVARLLAVLVARCGPSDPTHPCALQLQRVLEETRRALFSTENDPSYVTPQQNRLAPPPPTTKAQEEPRGAPEQELADAEQEEPWRVRCVPYHVTVQRLRAEKEEVVTLAASAAAQRAEWQAKVDKMQELVNAERRRHRELEFGAKQEEKRNAHLSRQIEMQTKDTEMSEAEHARLEAQLAGALEKNQTLKAAMLEMRNLLQSEQEVHEALKAKHRKLMEQRA